MSATVAKLRPIETEPPEVAPAPADTRQAFAFQKVGKSFGDKVVLDAIDLTVPAGQFIAVVGKSGCGKSTLLRLLTGLDRPTAGTLSLSEADAGHSQTRFMFQEPRLLPWASVVENVEVGLTGIASGAQSRRRALALLAEVGLAERAADWPAVLSGGQKQRVALARALVGQPQILALDEPLGALDALTRIEMQLLLERIWAEQRFTAVLVTHDVAEATVLADRIVVIDHGRIALDLAVNVPRPRRHGSPELAAIEGRILDYLFNRSNTPSVR